MAIRDEFTKPTIDALARRVGFRCSNPGCVQVTAGPGQSPAKAVNIGVAAHICAAAPGGPRFDDSQSPEERSAIENGIWLCQNCAKLVDNDPHGFTPSQLRKWKQDAEFLAGEAIHGVSKRALPAELAVVRKNIKISQERHDYSLHVSIKNTGAITLVEYHVDLELPTVVISDLRGSVTSRSDALKTLFRTVKRGAEEGLFPGDSAVLFELPYHVTTELFWRRASFFDLPVKVSAYSGGATIATLEMPFSELQIF